MSSSLFLKHLRDILILPFTVTCIVPYFISDPEQSQLPDNFYFKILGFLFLFFGLVLFFYTVLLFNRIGKGTLAPWSPKQKLIIEGPYQFCRNPMITGVLSILIGESFLFHSTSILTWTLTFFIINNIYFFLLEEPGLEEKFGEDYKEYKRNVPRWIPRLSPFKKV